MDPQRQSCHNPDGPERGVVGGGNIRSHSRQAQRYQCRRCKRTVRGDNRHTVLSPAQAHGVGGAGDHAAVPRRSNASRRGGVRPRRAGPERIRRIARWFAGAGHHCQLVHEHLVEQGQADVQHVQADELWVKLVGAKVWMALALAAPTRLWLGGVISRQRDLVLITRLVQRVRACVVTPAILVCVDGLASYVTAFLKVFRQPIRTGRRGRPQLVLPGGFQFAQVVKHSAQRHVVEVTRRVVHGTLASIEAVLTATATGVLRHRRMINTAYIERLNVTCRAHLAPLTRRGRAIARTDAVLTAGMWLVGTAYHFCWLHDSLRQLAPNNAPRKWLHRTPAMAAGLADHCWTMDELLRFSIPLPRWVPPKRRGRPPKCPPLGAVA